MAQTTLKKENAGYNYKYTDLAQINQWCEAQGIRYSQVITIVEGNQYISTTYTKDGKEYGPFLGAQVIKAAPGGKVNEAQIYGSGLTYARRYSLLMCFGLATDDDDAQCYTGVQTQAPQATAAQPKKDFFSMMEDLKKENPKTYDSFMFAHGIKSLDSIAIQNRREIYNDLKKTIELAKENN